MTVEKDHQPSPAVVYCEWILSDNKTRQDATNVDHQKNVCKPSRLSSENANADVSRPEV